MSSDTPKGRISATSHGSESTLAGLEGPQQTGAGPHFGARQAGQDLGERPHRAATFGTPLGAWTPLTATQRRSASAATQHEELDYEDPSSEDSAESEQIHVGSRADRTRAISPQSPKQSPILLQGIQPLVSDKTPSSL